MTSVRDIEAEDILNKNAVSIHPEKKISKAVALMEKENLREIPVVDGKKFKGMLSYRDIVRKRRSDPSSMKVETLAKKPPEIDAGMNLVELAGLRKNSGCKRCVKTNKGKLEGVIGEEDMIYPLADGAEEIDRFKARDLMNTEVITAGEDVSHETVANLMQNNKISQVPILNPDGEVSGVVSEIDSLRTMVPREQMDYGDVKGDKEEMDDIPAREIMNTSPPVLEDPSIDVVEAIKYMRDNGLREAIFVDSEGKPEGILTLKDVIDFVANLEPRDAVLVNLVGLESDSRKSMVHEQVEKALQGGLGNVLNNPRELTLHIKMYEKDGKQQKFSVHSKLFSRLGITTVAEHGWNLRNVVDEVLDKLAEVVRRKKEKRRDLARKKRRDPAKGPKQ
ncbi:MAG: CBS domain-containing protein [Candidatus Nanohaloarchaea archaeon]|nr:CBS domain-containing protein [Candidatus Nanohaloarchaea archaeon]